MQCAMDRIIRSGKMFLAVSLLTAYCLLPITAVSQELNCSIQILAPQLQNPADKKILETLKASIYEFMNNRKWTNDVFKQEEKIECSILITISEKPSTDQFKGTMQVQVRRPIYKSSYNSLLMNVVDKNISFTYVEYQPLEFSESAFISNLTSLLAYYSYLIIATDYDSYSMEGGTPYYQKAQNIVSNAQSGADPGWKSSEDTRNRYWIVENLLNSTFQPMRECIYKYHRLGFDVMSDDLAGGRAVVSQSLLLLKKIHDSKPLSYNMQLFFLAKTDEIINLFKPAEPAEKTKVVELLNTIDPGNTTKYNKINEKDQ